MSFILTSFAEIAMRVVFVRYSANPLIERSRGSAGFL
jgi:hypothetical protein